MERICIRCHLPKNETNFHRKGNGFQSMCKECRKIYIREHYQKNKQKYIDKARESNHRLKEWFRELKRNLACERCGEKHIACLEFHHVDPSKKDFQVGGMATWGRKRLLKEIDKCVVLCANCHRKEHHNGV